MSRYALIHELGGVIVPVRAKALAIPQADGSVRFVKSVRIPARPYLRPAADTAYPKLAGKIRTAFERSSGASEGALSMPEAADLEGGLVAYLKSIPSVAVLTSSRIFGGELPGAETASMPRAAIVLESSGGISLTGESTNEHDTQRLDVFAFGPTPREAARVMRAAALALRRLERSVHAGCLLHWANSASRLAARPRAR